MRTRIACCIMLSLLVSASVAQEPAAPVAAAPTPPKKQASPQTSRNTRAIGPNVDAYDAVDRGNRLLKAGDAKDALPLYQHAAKLKPDAREIAFAEGLSHYHLGEYDEARKYFDEASLGHTDALADKALYSAGASYHEEALAAAKNDPKAAISNLENAMQRYQSVLAHDPNFKEARDANYKAGHTWRQIKKLMKQQQKQQQQNGDKKNKDDQKKQDQKKDQQNQQQKNQNKKDQKQQDQQQKQQQQQDQKQQDQQQQQQSADQKKQDQQSESDEQKKEQQSAQKQDEQKDESQKKQKKLTEQDVSREQAERKLREMMQAQRQREKQRAKKVVPLPPESVDKDW